MNNRNATRCGYADEVTASNWRVSLLERGGANRWIRECWHATEGQARRCARNQVRTQLPRFMPLKTEWVKPARPLTTPGNRGKMRPEG